MGVKNILGVLGGTVRRGAQVLMLFAAFGVVWSVAQDLLQRAEAPLAANPESAWGGEVLASIHDKMEVLAPIRLANACGLGASSCFKCHNGSRAAAPADKPWHSDHGKVNNSCVGCHDGNARLLKKDIAHGGLVGNPVPQAQKYCASCHKQDHAELAEAYQQTMGGGR